MDKKTSNYYREHPDKFLEDYFNVRLYNYQILMLKYFYKKGIKKWVVKIVNTIEISLKNIKLL